MRIGSIIDPLAAAMRRCLVASCLAAALMAGAGAAPAPAASHAGSIQAQRPLRAALRGDGTLRDVHGSFDARGYRLERGRDGAPRFARVAQAAGADAPWSDRFGAVGIGTNQPIFAVAVDGANVYVGGSFAALSTASGVPAGNVAKWNGSGWSALGTGTNGTVRALAVLGGSVYAGGDFTTAGGVAAVGIARWSGTAWAGVGGGVSSTSSFPAPRVNALTVSGTKLYAGGTFDKAGSTLVHSLAAWNGSAWSPVGGGVLNCGFVSGKCSSATPASGTVDALLATGGRLYVGGSFNDLGGTEMDSLAVWSGTAWSSPGAVRSGSFAGTVNAMATNGTSIFVGGKFDHVGGVAAENVASLTGATWKPLAGGAANCGCAYNVTALAWWGGRLFMTGQFSQAGTDGAPGIAQWNGSAWLPVGGGLDGTSISPPFAMAVSPSGLVVAGAFGTAASQKIALNHIGLWNGTSWTGYGLGIAASQVEAMAASGHDLYVGGGGFGRAGWTAGLGNVGHFNGTTWEAMGGGVNSTGVVNAIAVDGTNVYIGGSFTQAGGQPAAGIARWDGHAWHPLRFGVDGQVKALLVYNGKLWVGGLFRHAGNRAAGDVAANDVATWDLTNQVWAPAGGNLDYETGGVNALAGVPAPYQHFVAIGGDFAQVRDRTPLAPQIAVNGLLLFDTTAKITSAVSGYQAMGTPGAYGVTCGCFPAARVNALVVDGTKLLVGGVFSRAGAVNVRDFAQWDLLATKWTNIGAVGGGSTVSGAVNAITQVGSSYYLAGDFTSADGVPANAIVRYTRGTAPPWTGLGSGLARTVGATAPPVIANALAQSADGLYVGGTFDLAGGLPSEKLGLWTATKPVA